MTLARVHSEIQIKFSPKARIRKIRSLAWKFPSGRNYAVQKSHRLDYYWILVIKSSPTRPENVFQLTFVILTTMKFLLHIINK